MITQVTEDGSSTDDHANTSPLRKLAQSNSKSEDTPDPSRVDGLTDKLRGLLNKDGVWSSEYNGVLLEIEEASAKINRLIVEARLSEMRKLRASEIQDKSLYVRMRTLALNKELGDSNE